MYSGVFSLDGKEDDEKLMAAFRASGASPFCVKASAIPLQARKLLKELSRFEPHVVSDASGVCVEVLYLLGAPAHADVLSAFLKGDCFAGCALRRIGDGAQKDVAGIWEKLSKADRWKLLTVPGCVPKATALSYAIASLGSESPTIRGSAIRWLGQHKAPEGRRPLLDRLRAEKSSLRWEIVDALAEIGGEEVVDAMVKLLARGSWARQGRAYGPPAGPDTLLVARWPGSHHPSTVEDEGEAIGAGPVRGSPGKRGWKGIPRRLHHSAAGRARLCPGRPRIEAHPGNRGRIRLVRLQRSSTAPAGNQTGAGSRQGRTPIVSPRGRCCSLVTDRERPCSSRNSRPISGTEDGLPPRRSPASEANGTYPPLSAVSPIKTGESAVGRAGVSNASPEL